MRWPMEQAHHAGGTQRSSKESCRSVAAYGGMPNLMQVQCSAKLRTGVAVLPMYACYFRSSSASLRCDAKRENLFVLLLFSWMNEDFHFLELDKSPYLRNSTAIHYDDSIRIFNRTEPANSQQHPDRYSYLVSHKGRQTGRRLG